MTDQTRTGSADQEVAKTEDVEFDVTSVMDEVAANNFKVNGRWKKKGRVSDLKPVIQAKFAEVGRLLSTEEVDELYASLPPAKEVDLDATLTAEEMKKKYHGKETIFTIRRSVLADRWIYDQRLGTCPAKLDKRFQKEEAVLIERLGRSLNLLQTQNVFAKVKEERELEAYGPDGPVVCCGFPGGCTFKEQPTMKTLTQNGRKRLHDAGPLKGLPKRIGNHIVFPLDESGENFEVRPLCSNHVMIMNKAGWETYPKEDAEKFIELRKQEIVDKKAAEERQKAEIARKKAEADAHEAQRQRDFEIAQKLLASNPAARAKDTNKKVRDMVEGGRVNRKGKGRI